MWQAGIFYPRWLPDSFHGFGAPSFYYYPPFTYALSSILYVGLPGLSPDSIGKVLAILAFAFSGLSMWLYLRWRSVNDVRIQLGRTGIILGSLIYAFAPYRIFNYATRGALPEHIAIGFVPLVFWGADLLIERRKLSAIQSGIALLILSLSLLILTNLPGAAATGIGIFVYVFVRVDRRSRMRGISMLLFGSFAALLLTAFYLLPVGAKFGDVQLGRLWRPVPFILSSPFLAIFTGQAITINSYTFVSLIGACILLIGWMCQRRTANPLFWLLALVIAVQLPFVAKYLFVYVPPFTIVQLSYRMSIILLVVVAIAWQKEIGNIGSGNDKKHSHYISIVVAFWSICTIVLVGLQLAGVHIHKHGPLPVGEAPEYATRWARPYYEWGHLLSAPFANDSENIVWPADAKASVISSIRKTYSDTVEYESGSSGDALIRRSYWPTWKATIDGSPIATGADSLGRLRVETQPGRHKLVVWLENSRAVEVGGWISLSSLLILIAGWIFGPMLGRLMSKSEKSSA